MNKTVQDIRLIVRGIKEINSIKKGLLELSAFRAVFSALSPFINIYLSALIIDEIAAGAGLKRLFFLASITVSANLFVHLMTSLLNRIINVFTSEFDARYEMKLNDKILKMNYADVENPQTHRMREKINEIRAMNGGGIWRLIHFFPDIVKSVFTIVFSVSLTFSLFFSPVGKDFTGPFSFAASPIFSVILVAGIMAHVFIGMYTDSTSTKKMFDIMNGIIPLNRVFNYYFGNYIPAYQAGKDIRIYNQHNLINEEVGSVIGSTNVILNKLAKNELKYAGATTVSSVLVSALVNLFVGLKALAGLFGVGLVVRYIGSINEFKNGFSGLMTQFATLRANNEAMTAYFDYIDIPDKKQQGSLPVEKRAFCDGGDNEYEIEFRDVSFKYPASDTYALRHVSMKLRIGRRLAVVGMNGSGKTTFIKLLCRLYDPTEGEILLNGINIKKYDYYEYMSIFSVVFQDFKLFSFSLGQNVAAGVEYDAARARACLNKAGFAERLKNMPKELDTCLYKDFEENGVEISGGEAQKIAIARALYKDAPFIVLDEPTAALDPVAEYEVYSKFNEIIEDKTAIYISHRLSSCRFCDNIAVFDKGQIVQQGSHGELVADENGKYHELWYAQAQYYNT